MKKKHSHSYGYDNVYCYEGSDVLKNKLNIREADKLYEIERQIVNVKMKLVYQMEDEERDMDKEFFLTIHHILFENIYEWAGKLRTVDIAKGTLFCRTFAIQCELDRIFNELRTDNYLIGYPEHELVEKMAYYISELNAIHPFREGNGRTQRLFMEIIANKVGYYLDFSEVTDKEMIEASYDSFKCNYDKMNNIFRRVLVKFSTQVNSL